mmetsp:Transcript_9326/g.22237  ORF Transcript_9326/g.22237 Transcript_9326/m.22237 type:complete len:406 (-) Transcript_9326:2374-3591(-)
MHTTKLMWSQRPHETHQHRIVAEEAECPKGQPEKRYPSKICQLQDLVCTSESETWCHAVDEAAKNVEDGQVPECLGKVGWKHIKDGRIESEPPCDVSQHIRPSNERPGPRQRKSWHHSAHPQAFHTAVASFAANCRRAWGIAHKDFAEHQKAEPKRVDESKAVEGEASQSWLSGAVPNPVFEDFTVIEQESRPQQPDGHGQNPFVVDDEVEGHPQTHGLTPGLLDLLHVRTACRKKPAVVDVVEVDPLLRRKDVGVSTEELERLTEISVVHVAREGRLSRIVTERHAFEDLLMDTSEPFRGVDKVLRNRSDEPRRQGLHKVLVDLVLVVVQVSCLAYYPLPCVVTLQHAPPDVVASSPVDGDVVAELFLLPPLLLRSHRRRLVLDLPPQAICLRGEVRVHEHLKE